MSHEIKTRAGNRVWGLLLADREDEIEESDILAIEVEARQQDASPLRYHNALRTAIVSVDPKQAGPFTISDLSQFVDAVLAALPPSAPPGLDVERLAEAYHMSQLCVHGIGAGEPMQKAGYLNPDQEAAQVIAAEYARLEQDHP